MESGRKRLAATSGYMLAGYLYGSAPFVDLLARARGVNLKKEGSKNVGAANLFSLSKSFPLAASAWLLDFSKGALPPLVALKCLPLHSKKMRLSLASAGATAGVAGQCWPIFLSFSGGRGVAPIIGASSLLAPRLSPYLLAMMAAARLLRFIPALRGRVKAEKSELVRLQTTQTKSGPLSVAIAICSMPPLCLIRGYEREVVLATTANAVILLLRRLTANPLPEEGTGGRRLMKILLNRLLYDRDTGD